MLAVGQDPALERDPRTAVLPVADLDALNRRSGWSAVAADLQDEDLVGLIRAFVVAERELQWIDGSVAATIWLYRCLAERSIDTADAITPWIVKQRGNPWVPFGTTRDHGATTLREWRARDAEYWRGRRQANERNRVEQARAKQARLARQREERKKHEERSRRSRARREKSIAALAALTPLERLRSLSATQYSADYYPACFADVTDDLLGQLETVTRHALLERLRRVRNPAWRDLRRRLRTLQETADDVRR